MTATSQGAHLLPKMKSLFGKSSRGEDGMDKDTEKQLHIRIEILDTKRILVGILKEMKVIELGSEGKVYMGLFR